MAGVGLTRNILGPLGWVAVHWAMGLVLLVQFLRLPPGTTTVSDRGAIIPPQVAAVPMIFAFSLGIVVGTVAMRTYQAWGRRMTTRLGGAPAPLPQRSLYMRRPAEPD